MVSQYEANYLIPILCASKNQDSQTLSVMLNFLYVHKIEWTFRAQNREMLEEKANKHTSHFSGRPNVVPHPDSSIKFEDLMAKQIYEKLWIVKGFEIKPKKAHWCSGKAQRQNRYSWSCKLRILFYYATFLMDLQWATCLTRSRHQRHEISNLDRQKEGWSLNW